MNPKIRELAEQALLLHCVSHVRLEQFAALVAAHEREECAKVANRQNGDDEEDSESCVWSKAARHIAAVIRARESK